MNIFKRLYYKIQVSDNDTFLRAIEFRDNKIKELDAELKSCEASRQEALKDIDELIDQLPKESEMDKYCKKRYVEIPLIAYKQKRKIIGKRYTISLHELITPDSWEIAEFKKGIAKVLDKKDQFRLYGDKLSTRLTWTDDKNLDTSGDYYLYPNETLTLINADCEDHTFVMCSLDKDIGGAWGFLNSDGHAFNCFIYEDELYILDTVGNQSIIIKYSDQKRYKINYIITKEHAYKIDGSVQFGEIAGWN